MDKVLKTLERHYHVVFEVKDNEILKSIITARFKDEQLPQVLEYEGPQEKLKNKHDKDIIEKIIELSEKEEIRKKP